MEHLAEIVALVTSLGTAWGVYQRRRRRRAERDRDQAIAEARAARVDVGLADRPGPRGSRIGEEARESWDRDQR